jgi:phage tail sheath protein FI
MAAAYKTPGVYIVEKNAFPPSIVAVATAVPAFVGYTEIADNKGQTIDKPFRLSSMAEFNTYFGGPPKPTFELTPGQPPAAPADAGVLQELAKPTATLKDAAGNPYVLSRTDNRYMLYYAMQMFFANGGGPCWIVSVGGYTDAIDADKLIGGVETLTLEEEPTMVLTPDAVSLPDAPKFTKVLEQVLMHCGTVMRNRIGLFDIYNGFHDRNTDDPVQAFRDSSGNINLDFGVTYYPWLNTTIVDETTDLNFHDNLSDATQKTPTPIANLADFLKPLDPGADATAAQKLANKDQNTLIGSLSTGPTGSPDPQNPANRLDPTDAQKQAWIIQTEQALMATNPAYAALMKAAARLVNCLPPSAAMAGLYTLVDNARGVWKAPANISVNTAVSPAVAISAPDQELLNVDAIAGKSINAIRSFIGEGVLVWGARTLAGNSLDWRYVPVRRTMIFLEESCKLAAKQLVFEPNVASTWLTVRSMIENFLTSIWRQGGLMGAVPADAFQVYCGLGDTMTPDDVLEGIMRVTVLVAMVRPAEFIEITFQQLMPKS